MSIRLISHDRIPYFLQEEGGFSVSDLNPLAGLGLFITSYTTVHKSELYGLKQHTSTIKRTRDQFIGLPGN